MTIEAELADGRILEFPDGTDPGVIQATVKKMLGPAPSATTGERGQAALGGVNTGIAGLVGLPMDTAENIVNLGLAGAGSLATAAGKPDLAPSLLSGTPGGSESIKALMRRFNIGTSNPRPDDLPSRMLHTGGVIAGGSMVPGASVKGAATAATGGALAGEALGPEWVGVGAMGPAAASQVAGAAKNAVAARAAPIVETFKQAGTTPSVGQATDNVFIIGLENLASKFPGGAGVMRGFVANQQKQIGATARTGVPTEAAGRAIERGITGEGGFLDRTKATWQTLDDAVATKIPPDSGVRPAATLTALDDLTRPTPGAEKTSQVMSTPKLAEIKEAMSADISATGVMPYQALRALRSKVGAMLDNAMVTGIPGGELKKVYGALSKDLEAAAQQAGASQEFARQNTYYRARMGRIEDVLDRVIGKSRQPEDIFKAFNPTDPDQANKVRAVMRSLSPAERQTVSEAVVNRLGRAMPGKQNEFGELFSTETFLTNWNKLSKGARAQLFPDPSMRDNVEKIAKAASTIRSDSGVYANPSGTAGSFAAFAVYSSPIASATSGSLAPVLAGAGAASTAYVGAKMLTNPRIVEWLAKPVSPSRPGEAAAHLARLGVIYNQTKDPELRQELQQFIAGASK